MGFTLVEVLAALALTSLLLALAGNIAVSAWSGKAAVERSLARIERDAYLEEMLFRDIQSVVGGLSENPPLRLDTAGGMPQLELDVLTTTQESTSLHVAKYPATVTYKLERKRDPGTSTLLRTVTDRTVANAKPARRQLADDLAELQIALLVKGQWVHEYPSAAGSRDSVKAIRVSWRWVDSSATEVRTWLVPDAN